MIVVVGKSEVTNEVRMTSKAFDRFSEFFNSTGFIVELPNENGLIS